MLFYKIHHISSFFALHQIPQHPWQDAKQAACSVYDHCRTLIFDLFVLLFLYFLPCVIKTLPHKSEECYQ